jgi:hypothetical protein
MQLPGKIKLRQVRQVHRCEGRYFLRSSLTQTDPAQLWQYDIQLTGINRTTISIRRS